MIDYFVPEKKKQNGGSVNEWRVLVSFSCLSLPHTALCSFLWCWTQASSLFCSFCYRDTGEGVEVKRRTSASSPSWCLLFPSRSSLSSSSRPFQCLPHSLYQLSGAFAEGCTSCVHTLESLGNRGSAVPNPSLLLLRALLSLLLLFFLSEGPDNTTR